MRIELACERLGRAEVIRRCLNLLAGGSDTPEFVLTLGGGPARRLLLDGDTAGQRYWLRVWAARGLLWAGPGDDNEHLRPGLADDSWRVREMTCKVVARYRLGDLLGEIAALEVDPVARVRAAAARAAARIVQAQA